MRSPGLTAVDVFMLEPGGDPAVRLAIAVADSVSR
jgi:hypothetical protein